MKLASPPAATPYSLHQVFSRKCIIVLAESVCGISAVASVTAPAGARTSEAPVLTQNGKFKLWRKGMCLEVFGWDYEWVHSKRFCFGPTWSCGNKIYYLIFFSRVGRLFHFNNIETSLSILNLIELRGRRTPTAVAPCCTCWRSSSRPRMCYD